MTRHQPSPWCHYPGRLVTAALGLLVLALAGCEGRSPGGTSASSTGPDRSVATPRAGAKPSATPAPAGEESEASPFRFTDVTPQSGVDFVHVSGMNDNRPFPTANGSGVAIFDYDGDGLMDLYFASGSNRFDPEDVPRTGRNRLYKNLGDLKFRDVTEESGLGFHGFCHGVVAADFDNDGDQDVFLATYYQNTFYLNNGDGTFRDVSQPAGIAPPGFRGRITGEGQSRGEIHVDAIAGLKWRVDGREPSDDLTIPTQKGQRIVFRQADTEAPRGLELLIDAGLVRLLGETAEEKPMAVLVEVGPGGRDRTRLYQSTPPVAEGAEPVEMAVFEVARPITEAQKIGFECSEHRTAWSSGGAPIDFDGDGDLDLYVANYGFWTVEDHGGKWCGDQDKKIRQYCHPKEVTTVRHILYRNDGLVEGVPRFTDVTDEAGVNRADGHGFGVVAADLDGDPKGTIDLYVANDQNPAFLYLNNGDGTFRDVTELCGAAYDERGKPQSGMGADSGDVDNDGKPELFRTNFAGEYNTLFINYGQGVFYDQTAAYNLAAAAMPWVGWGCALADFDNDGWLDVFVTNGHVDNNYHLLGVDTIPYEEPPLLHRNVPVGEGRGASRRYVLSTKGVGPYFSSSHVGRGAGFGDLDNDGDLDIVVNHKDGAPAILRNDTSSKNHWLELSLLGRAPAAARDSIGAKVQVVTADGQTIYRDRKGGYSLESTNDPRVLIGLGATEKVETLIVRWPSGKEVVLKGDEVKLDAPLTLVEPAE
jgi:hypothetical protein